MSRDFYRDELTERRKAIEKEVTNNLAKFLRNADERNAGIPLLVFGVKGPQAKRSFIVRMKKSAGWEHVEASQICSDPTSPRS